jgi:flagellar motor switch/type III secretory pathway protein FliN
MNDERNEGPEAGSEQTERDEATRVMGSEQDAQGYRTEMMTGAAEGPASLLDRLELPIEVRFGKLEWELERVLSLRVGEAVPIGPDRDDSVTLYVQGRPYALGDLVVVEGRFGFRVRELLRND